MARIEADANQLKAKLRAIAERTGSKLERKMNEAAIESAVLIQSAASKGLRQGSHSGRIYVKGRNRDIIHQASAPGEYPATDTGTLKVRVEAKEHGADVVAFPKHAIFLEFGTRKMAPRPLLGNALRETRDKIERKFAAATKEGLKP